MVQAYVADLGPYSVSGLSFIYRGLDVLSKSSFPSFLLHLEARFTTRFHNDPHITMNMQLSQNTADSDTPPEMEVLDGVTA